VVSRLRIYHKILWFVNRKVNEKLTVF